MITIRVQGMGAGLGAGLLRAITVSLVAVAVGPAGIAMAESPKLAIVSPPNGSISNNRTPSFSGTGEPAFGVRLELHEGPVGGPVVETFATTPPFPESWSLGPTRSLADGTYTAVATQEVFGSTSQAVTTFTVNTTPPHVTLTFPANGSSTSSGSQLLAGSAGVAEFDLPTVTVQLFAGATIGAQVPLEGLTVHVSNGGWSATFGGLSPGVYTTRAEQSDTAGNTGLSAPVTFTVTTPALPSPPVASFKWFPSVPRTGQNVSLVSSSTDIASPITAFAWALTPNGPFGAGKPVLTTSFSTPGGHVVRLRVNDANGLSSVATETIEVTSDPLILMQPFPIVRIAGSQSSNGVHLSLLTAQAPVGARVTVRCRGRGCPARSETRVAASSNSKTGALVVEFRRFERPLRAGVTLEVRVSKPGDIGKYTRFMVRRGKLPVRVDSCLGPAGIKPIACPSS
jgi:hypothetical protein